MGRGKERGGTRARGGASSTGGMATATDGLVRYRATATDSERDGATGGTRREDVVAAECATADGGGDFVAKAQGPTRVMAGRAPTGSWREKSM